MSNPLYYPNRDMLASGFPTNWTLLKRLMWVRIMRGGGTPPEYLTVTGNPVSFSTVQAAPLRKLEVAFSPVQSLNGYDAPWPAGGGKNKCNPETMTAGYYNTSGAFQPQDATQLEYTSDYIDFSGTAASVAYFGDSTGNWVAISFFDSSKQFIERKATSNKSYVVTTVPSNAAYIRVSMRTYGKGLQYCYAALSSDDPTYSPYSNLCPISGWSSLTVEQRGKNLCPLPRAVNAIKFNGSGLTVSDVDDGVSVQGQASGSSHAVGFVVCKADKFVGQDVTISCVMSGSNSLPRVVLYLTDDAMQNRTLLKTLDETGGVTATIPNTAVGKYISYALFSSSGADSTSAISTYTNVQVELGTTATDYAPYNPSSRSISITLGETVYSGYVDVVTGVGEITWVRVDMGTANWNLHSNTVSRQAWAMAGAGSIIKAATSLNDKIHAISSAFKRGSYNDTWVPYMIAVPNNDGTGLVACFGSNAYSTNTEVQQALSGVQLCYELATPIPIQLAPQEVESLLGENNVWSTANGDLTVEYRSN